MKRPSAHKTLSELLIWFLYRRIRPAIWSSRKAVSLRAMTDAQFLRIAGLPDDPEAAVGEMRQRLGQRLFFHAGNRKDFFLSVLTAVQSYDDILDEADDVLENKFQTLGSGLVNLGPDIDWHRDFRSGTTWPATDPSGLDLLQLGKPSDVKVPWELSRFHQVWWLGKAYWLTNGQQYAGKFASLVEDWTAKNPVGLGVNWALGMEAAIRAANWVAGVSFFLGSPAIAPEAWVRIFKSLYVHGVFLEMNLEYAFARGNHYLSNVAGLVILGIVFRGTGFGDRWFSWGVRQLETEMGKQVYPDGVNYEKSTAYHRLVLELFYTPTILAERNGHRFSPEYRDRLRKMFGFTAAFQRPDGTIPNVGDADDGRLFRFRRSDDPSDCRHAMCVGAAMFNDPELRSASGGFRQDALWLIGTEAFEAYRSVQEPVSAQRSVFFPDGGFATMRSDDVHVFIDAGNIGMEGWGGHGHNDTLSFEYWADGHPLIVDSGTYAYTSDETMRQQLRSVRAHNTIMVDERELVPFAGLWSIRSDITRPEVVRWSSGSEQDTLVAFHEGYRDLFDPVIHERTFDLDKPSGTLTVTDILKGDAEHQLLLSLHVHPDVQIELEDNNGYILRCEGHRYRITTTERNCALSESWYSPSYGVKQSSRVLRIRVKAHLPHTIRTTIERLPA